MPWIKDGIIYHGGGVVVDGMRIFPVGEPDPELMRKAGYVEDTPPTPEPPDMTAFNAACQQFKQVCAQIALATGIEGFKGGFDEMVEFQQAQIFNTLQGMQLATAWNAADKLCTYEAAKIGIGQPEWWYRCWEEELKVENDEETPAD